MGSSSSSWPAAVVALGFLAFVAAVFLTVYSKSGIDDALKAWGAIGPIIAVVVGAIPSYFFAQRAKQEQDNANALRLAADDATIQKAKTYGLKV